MLENRSHSGKKRRQVLRLQMTEAQRGAIPERNRAQGTLGGRSSGEKAEEGASDSLCIYSRHFESVGK